MALLPQAHMASFLGYIPCLEFSQQMRHVPGNSSILESTLQLRLCLHITRQFHSERSTLIYVAWLFPHWNLGACLSGSQLSHSACLPSHQHMHIAKFCCWSRTEPHPLESGLQQALRTCAGESGTFPVLCDEGGHSVSRHSSF